MNYTLRVFISKGVTDEGLRQYIAKFVRECPVCQLRSAQNRQIKTLRYITASYTQKRSFLLGIDLGSSRVSPEPLHKRGTGCIPTSCILEKVSEYQLRQKSAFYRRKSTSRWFYRLRKMRRSLKATYLSQFKELLKQKTLCGRAYRTGVGKTAI